MPWLVLEMLGEHFGIACREGRREPKTISKSRATRSDRRPQPRVRPPRRASACCPSHPATIMCSTELAGRTPVISPIALLPMASTGTTAPIV